MQYQKRERKKEGILKNTSCLGFEILLKFSLKLVTKLRETEKNNEYYI